MDPANPACPANIGAEQRRWRRRFGAWALGLGFVAALGAWALGVAPLFRLLTSPLFFGGFVGVFQARDRTCVHLASRGLRDLGEGVERVEDPSERQALRSQATRVMWKALGATVVLMIGVLLLP